MIFVGILERVVDDFNRERWQPQMEGGKAGRELPGIVDQVDQHGFRGRWRGLAPRAGQGPGPAPRLRSGNPYALPAKDGCGQLNVTEPPDLGALLTRMDRNRRSD